MSFHYFEMLGKGTYGEVYLAKKKSNDSNKLYAIKILTKEKIFNHNLTRYAKTERNVLSIMNHPFIVKLNFAFQTEDKLFLAMDYCPGFYFLIIFFLIYFVNNILSYFFKKKRGDLGKMLAKNKKISESLARIYISEILISIEALHKSLIIFR